REAIQLQERREALLDRSAIAEERKPLTEELCNVTSFLVDHGLTEAPLFNFAEYRDRARKRVDELIATSPGTSVHDLWRFARAGRSDLFDGHVARDEGAFDRARALYTRAVERLRLPAGEAYWFWVKLYLAHAHRGLAMVAHEMGDQGQADREFA